MKIVPSNVKKIFAAKQVRRNTLARLPMVEKVRILLELQQMAAPVLARRGLKRGPWKIKP